MANPVVHFEVIGKDVDALQSFYGSAFDWEFERPMAEYGLVAPGEGGIGGGVGTNPEGGDGHVTFYVQVEDPEAALAKIEALGGRRVQGPMDVPGGPTIALFADPEGHIVGLVGAGAS